MEGRLRLNRNASVCHRSGEESPDPGSLSISDCSSWLLKSALMHGKGTLSPTARLSLSNDGILSKKRGGKEQLATRRSRNAVSPFAITLLRFKRWTVPEYGWGSNERISNMSESRVPFVYRTGIRYLGVSLGDWTG